MQRYAANMRSAGEYKLKRERSKQAKTAMIYERN